MTSLNRKNSGFTIVELLIVIVVIGILAGLVVTTFSGIQKKARDKERQTDINALHGQVEAYYAQNGKYPMLADVNSSTWRSDNMKGLDGDALKDPNGGAIDTLATTVSSTQYRYDPTKEDNTACDNTVPGDECVKYTLEADLEEGTTYEKTSLN